MSKDELGTIRGDMTFYLDKMFQFSFVYIAAVFAALAGAKATVVSEMSKTFCLNRLLIVFAAILLLNLLYLTLAGACGLAVLKRAYFILTHGNELSDGGNALVGWEKFTRKSDKFPWLTWNMDNIFTVMVYIVVVVLSVFLVIYCLCRSKEDHAYHTFIIILTALYIVPAIAILQTFCLGAHMARVTS